MTRTTSALFATLLLTTISVGCATDPERVGRIDIPLTAVGASGATYRLPAGTAIDLFSDTFFGDFPLDGDAPSLTVDVPPGTYGALLVDPARDTTVWPLTRTTEGGIAEIVQATLDPIPEITVTENQTTALVLRFHVVGGGPIMFTHGSIAVSLTVDEGAGSSFRFALAAPSLSVGGVRIEATAPPQLADRVPGIESTGLRYSVVGQTIGPFVVASPGSVCAPATATVSASGPQFSDLLVEATGPDGSQLCFEQIGPTTAALVFQSARFGAPATPLLSDLASKVVVNYGFEALFEAAVFDGTTLRPGALIGTHEPSVSLFAAISGFTATGTQQLWYFLNTHGTGGVTLTPQ